MINLKDYEDEKGNINWEEYHAAEVAAGERCYNCNKFMVQFSQDKYRQLCSNCKDLDNDIEKVKHNRFVRCPKCKHQQEPYEYGPDTSKEEDQINCDECNHRFTIGIIVEYKYESPPLFGEEDLEEEDND